eukprot:COSAG01_NODE_3957_length_5496_cov_3.491199_3_plen_513_part_00
MGRGGLAGGRGTASRRTRPSYVRPKVPLWNLGVCECGARPCVCHSDAGNPSQPEPTKDLESGAAGRVTPGVKIVRMWRAPNLVNEGHRPTDTEMDQNTTMRELRLKLFNLTGCEPACQHLQIPLDKDPAPTMATLGWVLDAQGGWGQDFGRVGTAHTARYQPAAHALAQRRLAFAKALSIRLCPASIGLAPDIVGRVGNALPLHKVCMALEPRPSDSQKVVAAFGLMELLTSVHVPAGRYQCSGPQPLNELFLEVSHNGVLTQSEACDARARDLQSKMAACQRQRRRAIQTVIAPLLLGGSLVEGGLASCMGDVVLICGAVGLLIVLATVYSARKYHVTPTAWMYVVYVAIEGLRIYGAGRGCPLSFDRTTNLNREDLSRSAATYGDLWSHPDDPPGQANPSGCALAFAPGFIPAAIAFFCLVAAIQQQCRNLQAKWKQLECEATMQQQQLQRRGGAVMTCLDETGEGQQPHCGGQGDAASVPEPALDAVDQHYFEEGVPPPPSLHAPGCKP